VQNRYRLQMQYAESRQRAWELLVAAIREGDNAKMEQYQAENQVTQQLLEQINSGE